MDKYSAMRTAYQQVKENVSKPQSSMKDKILSTMSGYLPERTKTMNAQLDKIGRY